MFTVKWYWVLFKLNRYLKNLKSIRLIYLLAYFRPFSKFVIYSLLYQFVILLFIHFCIITDWRMISWNDILSQYQFRTNTYKEHCDPSDLKNFFVEVIPQYHCKALNPNSNHLVVHSYHNVLLPILPSDDVLYDFPVSVSLTFTSSHYTGRQRIYFSTLHSFLSLYNHSDFIKMHMHNSWFLGKNNITIDLPFIYFLWQPELIWTLWLSWYWYFWLSLISFCCFIPYD